MEALLRWKHPSHGFISPELIISLAEKYHLIFSMGEWIIRRACTQLKQWHSMGFLITVAVNLSPCQFRDPKLFSKVEKILRDADLEPKYLVLEITETGNFTKYETALSAIAQFTALGVKVSIDDFGKGNTSLRYLNQFKIHSIKIDRLFIQDVFSKTNFEVIKMIIELGRRLGIVIIAEGIETVEQRRQLENISCTNMQGFLFSKAIPPEEVEAILHIGVI